jgi:hypothetical protein
MYGWQYMSSTVEDPKHDSLPTFCGATYSVTGRSVELNKVTCMKIQHCG